MKKRLKMMTKILAVAGLLIALAILIRGASDQFRPPAYEAAAPITAKFGRIAKWIPKASEFVVAVDVPMALKNPVLKDRLIALVGDKKGVVAELVAALVARQDAVGMLSLVGAMGEPGAPPLLAVIAQGRFDEKTLIPAVRAALAVGHSGLVAQEIGGRTLYLESDDKEPFGFAVLDDEHIAVGTRGSLAQLFAEGSDRGVVLTHPSDAVLFGRLSFGPRIKAFLPQGLAPISGIDFASPDARTLVADIPCGDKQNAEGIKMFIEGIRSLLLLQEEGNTALASILKGMSIEGGDAWVRVTCDALPLFDLWAAERR